MTEITPAVRDRLEREASVAQANAQFEKLKADFAEHPEQRLARDRQELERLQNDEFHQNARAAGNQVAEAQETALQARIAVAAEEAAKLHGADRIEHALTTDANSDPLFDGTNGSESELPMPALRAQVAEYRELGRSDAAIREAFNGARESRATIAMAKQLYEGLMSEATWVQRLAAGDKAARREFVLMSIVMNATPIEG